jgi:predicted Zn-dependent peptidase
MSNDALGRSRRAVRRGAHRLAGPLALLVAAMLGLALLPAGAPAGAAQEEARVYRATLPSGMIVVTREETEAQVAALSVFVRGGSRHEDPATVGAAHFMEHMFFQGTPLRPSSREIDAPITERGGWLNATTAWEGITFFGAVPNDAFDVMLDVISDILVNSTFPPAALDKERRVVIEELNRLLNDPFAYALESYAKTVFADHPARQMPAGDRATVRTVSRDTLLQFRDQYFRASNMVVAAVGNLDHNVVEQQVAAAFAEMPNGPPPVWETTPPPAAVQRTQRLSTGARQAQLVMGWPGPGEDSSDRYAVEVLNAALGPGGQRLNGELRDNLKLATRVDTGYWELTDVGTWLIAAAAEPDKVDAVVGVLQDQIRRVREQPLTSEELAEAQAYVRGSARRDLERTISQAQDLSEGISLGYYQPLESYLAKIGAVTSADVQRVARQYLDPDQYTLVVVGP